MKKIKNRSQYKITFYFCKFYNPFVYEYKEFTFSMDYNEKNGFNNFHFVYIWISIF